MKRNIRPIIMTTAAFMAVTRHVDKPYCKLCFKPTSEECSHVNCTNRRHQTAGYETRHDPDGHSGCYRTRPTNKE